MRNVWPLSSSSERQPFLNSGSIHAAEKAGRYAAVQAVNQDGILSTIPAMPGSEVARISRDPRCSFGHEHGRDSRGCNLISLLTAKRTG